MLAQSLSLLSLASGKRNVRVLNDNIRPDYVAQGCGSDPSEGCPPIKTCQAPAVLIDGKCREFTSTRATLACPPGFTDYSSDQCISITKSEPWLLCPDDCAIINDYCVRQETTQPERSCSRGMMQGNTCQVRYQQAASFTCPAGTFTVGDHCVEVRTTGAAAACENEGTTLDEMTGKCVGEIYTERSEMCPGYDVDGECVVGVGFQSEVTCPEGYEVVGDDQNPSCVKTTTLSMRSVCPSPDYKLNTETGLCEKIVRIQPVMTCERPRFAGANLETICSTDPTTLQQNCRCKYMEYAQPEAAECDSEADSEARFFTLDGRTALPLTELEIVGSTREATRYTYRDSTFTHVDLVKTTRAADNVSCQRAYRFPRSFSCPNGWDSVERDGETVCVKDTEEEAVFKCPRGYSNALDGTCSRSVDVEGVLDCDEGCTEGAGGVCNCETTEPPVMACPEGSHADESGACIKDVKFSPTRTCPGGMTWDGQLRTCISRTYSKKTTVCPGDSKPTAYDNNTCILYEIVPFTDFCLEGFRLAGDVCMPLY